jgi:MoxR-like ATPase
MSKHNLTASPADLTASVKEIVNKMFAEGTVEVEVDDKHLRDAIEVTKSSLRNLESYTNAQIRDTKTSFERTHADYSKTLVEFAKVLAEQNKRIDGIPVTPTATVDEATIRKVADETFRSLFVPVIKAGVESGEIAVLPEVRKTDPFFVENAQTRLIERIVKQKRHSMATGPSGSGKTYPIEQVLRKLGKRYIKVSVADGLTMADFLARANVRSTSKGTETFFSYGFLPLSMKAGIPIILDEIDQCQPEIVSILNAPLEYGTLFIPQTGETIKAAPGWQVFMTCNTLRDTSGLYQGFRLSGALLNRLVFIKSDYLPAADEVKILTRIGLVEKDAKTLVGLVNGLRAAHFAGKLTAAPSTRLAVRIARCLLGQDDEGNVVDVKMPLAEAFELCLLSGLPDVEVKEAASVIGTGL